jgi:hypothetical protein
MTSTAGLAAAFTLDRNGHPSGRVHFTAEAGVAPCGKATADPVHGAAANVDPALLVTCSKCKALR